MSTILANTNTIDRIERKVEDHLAGQLCRNCRSLLETPNYGNAKFEVCDQVWTCNGCGMARKWGENRPWESYMRPLLGCEHCGCVTRHSFLRVA